MFMVLYTDACCVAEKVSEEEENPTETVPLSESAEAPEGHLEASELFSVNGQEGESHSQDVSPGDDGGHFNKNEDIQAAFQDTAEIQRGPQAILESPLDILGFEIDPSSGWWVLFFLFCCLSHLNCLDNIVPFQLSDSLDSPRASDFSDNNANYDQASTSTSGHVWDFFLLASEFLGVYAEIVSNSLFGSFDLN